MKTIDECFEDENPDKHGNITESAIEDYLHYKEYVGDFNSAVRKPEGSLHETYVGALCVANYIARKFNLTDEDIKQYREKDSKQKYFDFKDGGSYC